MDLFSVKMRYFGNGTQKAILHAALHHMLGDIQGRFMAAASPCEVMQDIEHTIANLQQIQKDLQDTDEYRAAQLTAKETQVSKLKQTVENTKAEVEALLGFSLRPEHYTNGKLYTLLPAGCVHQEDYNIRVASLQGCINHAQAYLKYLKNPQTEPRPQVMLYGTYCEGNGSDQIQRTEQYLTQYKTALLQFVSENRPMDGKRFIKKLEVHLDAMLEAYLELRQLQQE